jgi:hypothetical protein
LAEDEESFVGFEGDFVAAIEAAAVIDAAIGGFDYSAAWLDDEGATGSARTRRRR